MDVGTRGGRTMVMWVEMDMVYPVLDSSMCVSRLFYYSLLSILRRNMKGKLF